MEIPAIASAFGRGERTRETRQVRIERKEAVPLASVSAVIVCYLGDPEEVREALASLASQTRPPGQIVVVDNSPDPWHREVAAEAGALYLHSGENLGFAQGVNLAAGSCSGELILLLNPDAVADPGCVAELGSALEEDPRAAVAGAQVLLPDGRVNAGDNPVHLAGFCWSGNYLGRPEEGSPRETVAVSGAALMVRASDFRSLGGFHREIFMYFEDTDLCWRARIAGRRVLFCPRARVTHGYEFDKGPRKLGHLEEGRLAAVLGNYEPRTLLVLAPLLLAVELVTAAAAARDGWFREKLGAWCLLWRRRQGIRSVRAAVKRSRQVPDRELLPEFSPSLDTPLMESPALRATRRPQQLYGRLVLGLLGARRGAR